MKGLEKNKKKFLACLIRQSSVVRDCKHSIKTNNDDVWILNNVSHRIGSDYMYNQMLKLSKENLKLEKIKNECLRSGISKWRIRLCL